MSGQSVCGETPRTRVSADHDWKRAELTPRLRTRVTLDEGHVLIRHSGSRACFSATSRLRGLSLSMTWNRFAPEREIIALLLYINCGQLVPVMHFMYVVIELGNRTDIV